MPTLRTTAGQLVINEQLPVEMRDYNRKLDKKALSNLLAQVAREHPDKYREISHKLANIGRKAAFESGGDSFGLAHMRVSPKAKLLRAQLDQKLATIDANEALTDDQRDELVQLAVGNLQKTWGDDLLQEAIEEDNPLARQVISGARGNKNNLAALRGGDLLYVDASGRTLPVPITRSYSEGLTPAQYWAGSYGSRAGLVDIKLGTARAGYLNKQLSQAAHRLLVTAADEEYDNAEHRGFPTDVDDDDNVGSLLATTAGRYPRNTILTSKILAELRRGGVKRLLVRSPTVGGASDGGILARDAGVRERGGLPWIGEQVGMTAAQALGEPLTQGQLGSKHSGGVAGTRQAVSGFALVNQLVQVPKAFKDGAAHAQIDGTVQDISPAPAGGQYITIDDNKHYVMPGHEVNVKRGQPVEAGDVLSSGIPNPGEIVKFKGVGEGRRYFTQAFRQAFRDAKLPANRRNVELLARGLIDHVRLNAELDEWLPGDVVSYQTLERNWQPREGHREADPRSAVGKYLERPVLHHTIGTKIRPSMLKDMEDFGVKTVAIHDDPPPFEPEMIRGAANLRHDPDWLTKMFGSGLRDGLKKDVHRGGHSSEVGTSFVPGLAKGVDFGHKGKVIAPHPPQFKQSAAPVQISPEALQLWHEQILKARMLAEAENGNQLTGYGSTSAPAAGNWLQRAINPHSDSVPGAGSQLRPDAAEAIDKAVNLGGWAPGPLGWTAQAAQAPDVINNLYRALQKYRANSQAQEFYDTAIPNIPSVYQQGNASAYQVPEIGSMAPLAKEWNSQVSQGPPSMEAALSMSNYWDSLKSDPNVAWPDQHGLDEQYNAAATAHHGYNKRLAITNQMMQQIREQQGYPAYGGDEQRQEDVLRQRWVRGDIADGEFTDAVSKRYPYYTGTAFSDNANRDWDKPKQPTYDELRAQQYEEYMAKNDTPEWAAQRAESEQWLASHDRNGKPLMNVAQQGGDPAALGRAAANVHQPPAVSPPPPQAPPKPATMPVAQAPPLPPPQQAPPQAAPVQTPTQAVSPMASQMLSGLGQAAQYAPMLEGLVPGATDKLLKFTGPAGLLAMSDPAALGRLAAAAGGNYKPPEQWNMPHPQQAPQSQPRPQPAPRNVQPIPNAPAAKLPNGVGPIPNATVGGPKPTPIPLANGNAKSIPQIPGIKMQNSAKPIGAIPGSP